MVINTNIEAQQTANNLNSSQLQLAKSLSRLSSGSKIIVPSDDAAGLAVSSRLNSQIKRLDSALNNVVNAVSFTQTQDGFMKTIDKAFRRMGELAMLAQDTTKSNEDRALYNQEFAQLKSYVSETTKQDFNGVSLFAGKTLDVTVDADGTTFSMVGINLEDPTYTSSINSGTDSWRLTENAYMISKDGYKAESATYKTSIDLWRNTAGEWATTDNGGIKIATGSYVNETAAATADPGEVTVAVDNYLSTAVISAGWATDFAANKITKAAHGMVTGEKLTFHSNAPTGTTAETTYYVNAADVNNVTLHTTQSDAEDGTNTIDLTRASLPTVSKTITSVAVDDNFTLASHGYKTGDRIVFTGTTPPAGTTANTTYYVKEGADVNTFSIHATAAHATAGTGKIDITAVGAGSFAAISHRIDGVTMEDSDDHLTKADHGLVTGDAVKISKMTGATGAAVETATYHVKKLTADTFELYTTAALTTKLDVSADGTAMRINLESSEANVAINDQGNEFKKGMFTLLSPITTGENVDAVLAKTGEVINIAKTTQDISSFATELGVDYDDVNLKSVVSSQIALSLVKAAITQVATDRAKLGAVQSRLNFTNEQLTVTKENLSAAISRIADVDVAEEATRYARYQILVASGTEMLKQANQLPQSALQLLR